MLVPLVRSITRAMPVPVATATIRALAAMTRRPAVSPAQAEALTDAKRMRFGAGNTYWSWGEGPLVVLVHGWGGRAAQLAPLAAQISRLGFRCVAMDVTGHGESPKGYTRWTYFLHDIDALTRTVGGDVYAYVGHSAGGLCVMASRRISGIRAEKYVCIACPSYPFPPIRVLQRKLNPREQVLERYKAYIAQQFGWSWTELEAMCSYADIGRDTLLIYDETDRFVSHTEGDRLFARYPGTRLIKTRGNSHAEILESAEVRVHVLEFLRTTTTSLIATEETTTLLGPSE